MKWCNLYSTESKYNISQRPSRYKRIAFCFLPLGICLGLLINFSYAYTLVLVTIIASLLFISIYLSQDNLDPFTHYLTITTDGLVKINNEKKAYQLLGKSRLGFIGCWLELQQSTVSINSLNKTGNDASRQLFIFRDSLSEQDYARLISVLKQTR